MKRNHPFYILFAATVSAIFVFPGCSTPEAYPSSSSRSTASLNTKLSELNAAMSEDSAARPPASSSALPQEAAAAARHKYPEETSESFRREFVRGFIDAKIGRTPSPNTVWFWKKMSGGWIEICQGASAGSGLFASDASDGAAYINGWNASAPTSSSHPQNLPPPPPPPASIF